MRVEAGNRVQGTWLNHVLTYDQLGRKIREDLPYSGASNGYHLITYDLANRPLSDSLRAPGSGPTGPGYRDVGFTYLGDTTQITDANKKTTTKVMDPDGRLRRVTDPTVTAPSGSGTTQYTFDGFGNLTKTVDATGKSSNYVYNERGFKVQTVDDDIGTVSLQVDSFGEVTQQKDAKLQVTTFQYDIYGRLIKRFEPESATPTTWTYGGGSSGVTQHSAGKVTKVVQADGYQETYTFDALGRPQTTTYLVNGTSYPVDLSYNTVNGQVDTVTYPMPLSGKTRFALKYVYDQWAFLSKVQNPTGTTVYWSLVAANDHGQPVTELLGNGAQINSGYTLQTNELIARQVGTGGSINNLQNLQYAWDPNGNMVRRSDQIQNLTEQFTVDEMSRLISATISQSGVQQSVQTYSYDAAGNVTSRTGIGSYDYTTAQPGCTYQTYAQPHAVRNAGGKSYCYDANGNVTSRGGDAVQWTSYNQPSLIKLQTSSVQFAYNPNHQRYKQIATYGPAPVAVETTYYIGGVMQVVQRASGVTEYRHLLPAGSGSAIYTVPDTGTASTVYTTSDHLGSADLVLDDHAGVMLKESFTPWGSRRGSNWLNPSPSAADLTAIANTTRAGFTGHEMLDAVGLVDMNGRVYDPTIGRFLSADSVVQSLGLTQSLNPYAYAGGNPVRYIDPSGHDFFDTLLSVAIIAVSIWAGLEVAEIVGDFLETCDAVGSLAADILVGASGGFVGGFVGVALSTGNLTAALHAGLISAAVGGAMGAAGNLWSGADPAASWKYPPNVIAHAVVGCGGAMLSGGNCGKGALAAAVSDVAGGFVGSDSNPFSGKSLGNWGDVIQGAEVGLVGGGTAALSGGSFRDGFTTGAAGYLFNALGHEQKTDYKLELVPDTPETRAAYDRLQSLADTAAANVDATCGWRCNLPWIRGTLIHSEFEALVTSLGPASGFTAEVSYKDGVVVPYGTAGSSRADVIFGSLAAPTAAYDLKTGWAYMSIGQAKAYGANLPSGTPFAIIRPKGR